MRAAARRVRFAAGAHGDGAGDMAFIIKFSRPPKSKDVSKLAVHRRVSFHSRVTHPSHPARPLGARRPSPRPPEAPCVHTDMTWDITHEAYSSGDISGPLFFINGCMDIDMDMDIVHMDGALALTLS